MIVEYIRYAIDGERAKSFEPACTQARESLEASAHCLEYALARCVEEPSSYTLRIEWDSLERHERGFRGNQEFRQFLPHIRPFIGDIEEMRHYAVVFDDDTGGHAR